ncbi:MAG TPA: class I SAM-dependent methyltransferase [Ktedonobacteraceae bacterium]|nr:class I SAM-dependent methyltransferase [Ktedonobacteraceae bacterium]
MAIPINTHEDSDPYVTDPEEAEEIERLLLQDHAITKEIGEFFPANVTPSPGQVVLDLACGPGGWAYDVACTHPEIQVIGLDSSQKMIRSAKARARASGLSNTDFQVSDILPPLDFPEDAFELVNARFLSTFITKDAWLPLLQECQRIIRPGGVMCLTDGEWAFSNGEACEQYASLLKRAMWLNNRAFGPQGRMIGSTLMLSHFLRQAGFRDIRRHAHILDYSYGTEEHTIWYQSTLKAFPQVTYWLTKTGMTTKEEFEQLCDRVSAEIQRPDFRAMLYFLTVWGIKSE